jgi:hypothetical protein
MPLFYFHFGDDDGSDFDDGIEFPSIEAAYLGAYHAAIDLWAEARHQGRDLSGERFIIRDAQGQVVLELPLVEVLGSNTAS